MKCPQFLRFLSAGRASPKAYDEIDAGIKPLVDAMNATGSITTIASCQGHVAYSKPPYVYFKATPAVSGAIERSLREWQIESTSSIGQYWRVKGLFNENFELVFLLHSPFYDERALSLFAPVEFLFYQRKIAKELELLEKLIEKATLLKSGEYFEPDVRAKTTK
ncbi:hypothetical protein ACLBKS_03550 [Hylemonella sp. W303a]|uniref:hypothetical protein n=1 Tax=Hylemonella sp. W303a TaxID=3389873 RepID=UPI00396B2CE7